MSLYNIRVLVALLISLTALSMRRLTCFNAGSVKRVVAPYIIHSGVCSPAASRTHTGFLLMQTAGFSRRANRYNPAIFSRLVRKYKGKQDPSSTSLAARKNDKQCNESTSSSEASARAAQYTTELLKAVRNKDFDRAMELFDSIIDEGVKPKSNIYTALLSVCYKKEHLQKAMEIHELMQSLGMKPGEATYISMIRCYADAGRVEEAQEILNNMIVESMEPKLRTFHPILQALCKAGDLQKIDALLQHMKSFSISLRAEQLMLMFEMVEANHTFLHDPKFESLATSVLVNISHDMIGMQTAQLQRVVSIMKKISRSQVADEGVLVESLDDICGPIIQDAEFYENATVTAVNTSYSLVDTTFPTQVAYDWSYLPIDMGTDTSGQSINFVPEKYTVLSAGDAVATEVTEAIETIEHRTTPTVSGSYADSDINNSIDSSSRRDSERSDRSDRSDRKSTDSKSIFQQARMVDISARTCLCPNCREELRPLMITADEQVKMRNAIINVATTVSAAQGDNLADFDTWLSDRPEYDFIVDGANVAYFNQNFDCGKFTFRQIELVVDKLLIKHPDKRVLVILPFCYSRKVIPNNVRKKKKKRNSVLSADDSRILAR